MADQGADIISELNHIAKTTNDHNRWICIEARQEIERCHKRLEIDHVFVLDDKALDGMRRKEVPYQERYSLPDGITARDETIKIIEDSTRGPNRDA